EEAEVAINTGRQKALAVPLTAVITKKGSKGVLVVDKGRAQFQKIDTGLSDGEKIAVLKGLKEGDLVVINPVGLKAGERVHPRVSAPGAGSK
ncbi:MAG TPA: HlyD family efflux transporter periplasmic adaptor subunit, partial [Desulfobaccales bacterium]|nr:HlyD family efflux transporter periplasmic adaptor subunit [Desulfobaccales bacterium]